MSSNRHLIEPATDMIMAFIQSNINGALDAVIADRVLNDQLPGLQVPYPQQYFIDRGFRALNTPAIFVVCDNVDFVKNRGANFISAKAVYGIAFIVEAQTIDFAARTSWRYQAALSQILDNARLTSSDNTFSLKIIVQRASFSEPYTDSTRPGEASEPWRKSAMLTCDVEFFEAL